ncbi:hypothetical protein PGT21_017096 [Puccinia graminis f. sp. tritici]|uniref:Uncharacterized protein n=1 Tax=Puccinia graminis f. sp. tritici TaxID=56615 RepID=A0A5B0PU85_PUCGR|nr:hypothetical protein PGT21_017096 [Puccinia graminis f. sp. tritici]
MSHRTWTLRWQMPPTARKICATVHISRLFLAMTLTQPRQRLILCLGPLPTRVTGDITTDNIISQSQRTAASYSVTTVEPRNHFQAL